MERKISSSLEIREAQRSARVEALRDEDSETLGANSNRARAYSFLEGRGRSSDSLDTTGRRKAFAVLDRCYIGGKTAIGDPPSKRDLGGKANHIQASQHSGRGRPLRTNAYGEPPER